MRLFNMDLAEDFTVAEWRLQHDLLNTLKDVADHHYTPEDAFKMIVREFGHVPIRSLAEPLSEPGRKSRG
jgi:hypothetical protein